MADGRDAADDEPGQLVGLARGRPADARLARDRGEPRDVDPVRAGDQADDRLEAPSSSGATKTSDLTIWPSSAPTAAAASAAVWVPREDPDLERHPLARRGVEDALGGGMHVAFGHGPESSTRASPVPRGSIDADGRDPVRLGRHARRIRSARCTGRTSRSCAPSACRSTRRPTGATYAAGLAPDVRPARHPRRRGSRKRTSSGTPRMPMGRRTRSSRAPPSRWTGSRRPGCGSAW